MKHKQEVIEWAASKGILDKGTPLTQALKTLEEVTELLQAMNNNDPEEVKDAYGDILVTIIIGAHMSDLDIEDCLESAYNVIAKRTGKMVNGTFVKDDNKACLICGGDFDNPMQEHLGACGSCFANRRPY